MLLFQLTHNFLNPVIPKLMLKALLFTATAKNPTQSSCSVLFE